MSYLTTRTRLGLRSLLGRAILLAAGGAVFGIGQSVFERLSAERTKPLASVAANLEISRLESLVDELKGRVEVTDLKAERLTVIGQYSAAYRIPAVRWAHWGIESGPTTQVRALCPSAWRC